ncbi:MAG: NAD(P)-dependent oxidoreductase [Acidimicrobiia bacterium]
MGNSAALKVGFVGVGDQGGPIARRIVDGGFATMLYARRAEALAPFADSAATYASSLAELASTNDVIGVCVRTDDDVDAVMLGDGGILATARPGTIVLIHSTASPAHCQQLTQLGAERSVIVLDAPVSGGRIRAAAGEMAVMVGGDKAAFDTVLPVLDTFATNPIWLGPIGSGQLAKLVNNVIFTINFGTALRLLDAGESFGLDRVALAQVVQASSGQSFAMQNAATAQAAQLPFAESLLRKDCGLFLDVMSSLDEDTEIISLLSKHSLEFMLAPGKLVNQGKTN